MPRSKRISYFKPAYVLRAGPKKECSSTNERRFCSNKHTLDPSLTARLLRVLTFCFLRAGLPLVRAWRNACSDYEGSDYNGSVSLEHSQEVRILRVPRQAGGAKPDQASM